MKFKTQVPMYEFNKLISVSRNAIANVLYNKDGKETFRLTREQSEELDRIGDRLRADLYWFIYDKDEGVNSE